MTNLVPLPCWCGHKLDRHIGQEGICVDCRCYGYTSHDVSMDYYFDYDFPSVSVMIYEPIPIDRGKFLTRIDNATQAQHEAGNHKDCYHEGE